MKNFVKALVCLVLLSLTTIVIAEPSGKIVNTKRFIILTESKNYVSPYVPLKTLDGYGIEVWSVYYTYLSQYKLSFDFYDVEDGTWVGAATPVSLLIYATVDAGATPFSVTIAEGYSSGTVFEDNNDVSITSTDPSTINGYTIAFSPVN